MNQILYWLSSGNDKDTDKYKDKDKDKVFQRPKEGHFFQKQRFQVSRTIFPLKKTLHKMFTQGFVDPGPEYLLRMIFCSGMNIFQGGHIFIGLVIDLGSSYVCI